MEGLKSITSLTPISYLITHLIQNALQSSLGSKHQANYNLRLKADFSMKEGYKQKTSSLMRNMRC